MAGVLDVAVVGGGISGLTAAYTLGERFPDRSVALIEASERLGGKLHTTSIDGIRIEAGADSFLARDEIVVDLCKQIGIADELHAPAVFGAVVWTDHGWKRLPSRTVMGVPASVGAALGAEPLSLRGRLRALGDLVLPGPLSGPDVAVGPFIRKRFGAEVLEHMVDPILAGTRAGDTGTLSLAACMPQIDHAARTRRSVMAGLRGAEGPPPFLAPETGMGRLIEALSRALGGTEVVTGAPVLEVRPGERSGWRLTLPDRTVGARSVVVAAPAGPAAKMLVGMAPEAARELRGISHASVAAVTLVYPPGAMDLPSGTSGFLVPSGAERLLSAGTWWSLKWPGSGAGERTVVRAFIGRAGHESALDDNDGRLIERSAREIERMVGTTSSPQAGRVHRWPDGLPQYEVGHADRIERIGRALRNHRGLLLAGADYRGTGIPDCIRQGREAALAAARATVESGA